ncbi:MAG: lipoprotein signal peptidase [Chroococcus sp. CMT-3BRIN-NPC107]|jgi:signal peptidase II|nr:lipoprotein signal peptidase [Chroococcus sp. CMT-3BRIN-NPC107]
MRFKNSIFWIAATISFCLDQATKYWIVQNFNLLETQPLIPGVFHFTYVRNTGAAFSLLSGRADILRWLSLFVSLGLIAFALFGGKLKKLEQLSYGLLLGGAMGNGIDRFIFGSVVDFIDLRLIRFAVFNLADVSINLGIICWLIDSFYKPKSDRNSRS